MKQQDKHILAIFSLLTLVIGLLGTFIIAIFDDGLAIGFAVLFLILTLVFGLISWKENLAKIAVVSSAVIITLLIIFFAIWYIVRPTNEFKDVKRAEKNIMIQKKQKFEIINKNSNDINVTIETNKDVFHINETIIITYIITNNSDKEYKFCCWQTPLEKEFTADFFEIIHNEEKVKYIGSMIKRKPPAQDDFIILKPKEKISQKIELNKGYNINETGEFQIKFIGRLINKLPNSDQITISIIDNN